MADETLSPIQAKKIVTSVNEQLSYCIVQIEDKCNTFIHDISRLWEDNIAVECFAKLKKDVDSSITNLNKNNQTFATMIESIANQYARVGKKPPVSVDKISLSINIDISPIKNYFEGHNNPDDFGFLLKNNDLNAARDLFFTLFDQLRAVVEETYNKILSTNAFGNTQVQHAIATSGKEMGGILMEALEKIFNIVNDGIRAAYNIYASVGEMSENSLRSGGWQQ